MVQECVGYWDACVRLFFFFFFRVHVLALNVKSRGEMKHSAQCTEAD
jgi:hypothetical protein